MTVNLTPTIREAAEYIETLLRQGDSAELKQLLLTQHPADIADMLEVFREEDRLTIFMLLPQDIASEVLDETRTNTTRELIASMPLGRVADLLENMPADDAAAVLSEIESDQAEGIFALIEPEEAAEIGQLLTYPEYTAGRLMTTRLAYLQENWTSQEAIEYLRELDPDVETLTYLYVVDPDQRLRGIIPIRALLTAQPLRKIGDLMNPNVISVDVMTDQEEVARLVQQYDFFALPVVDDERLMGIITHDDVVDILQEEFTEDAQRFGGSQPLEGDYLSSSIVTMVKKRIGWLLLLFVTGTLTGTVMLFFEADLARWVQLSLFIPLLIGTGGNAGSQITATMIRAVAIDEVRFSDIFKVLRRELITGLILGAIVALAGIIRALTWNTGLDIALTIASALIVLVIWANLMGALLPLIAAKLKIDPASISGPVMSTLVDATGLLIYFGFARLFLA